MTRKVLASAEAVAPAEAIIQARTSHDGPPAIQGPEDGAEALPGLLREIEIANNESVDAFVIACFDDTGIEEARNITNKPVLGIGQSAFHASMLLGRRFSVVTTLSVSVPVISENVQRYGVASYCCAVRASDVPVLELEKTGSDAEAKVSAEIANAIKEDHCEAIVLGCAGMTDLAARLTQVHGLPVIDGVVAATGLACALTTLTYDSSR